MNARLAAPVALGLLAAMGSAAFFAGWRFDDSYIAWRFARHIAEGFGPAWNPGEPPVEGFTSLSWTLISAAIATAGVPPESGAVWFGTLCLAATVPTAAWFSRRLAPSVPEGAPAVAVASNVLLGFHASHGLETSLHVLVSLGVAGVAALMASAAPGPDGAAEAPTRESAGPRTGALPWTLAGLSLLAVTTRPDAAITVIGAWGILALLRPESRRDLIAPGIALSTSLVGVEAWRWITFGDWVPNTFHVKASAGGFPGLSGVTLFSGLCLPVFGVVLWGAVKGRGSRAGKVGNVDAAFLTLLLPAVAALVAWTRPAPILAHGFRFLIAAWPVLVLAAARAVHIGRLGRSAAGILALSAIPFDCWFAVRAESLRAYLTDVPTVLVPRGKQLAAAARLDPPPLLATADIGALAYYSGLPTFDLVGLVDPEVAAHRLDSELFLRRKPDLLILQDLKLLAGADPAHLSADALDARAGRFADHTPWAHLGELATRAIVSSPGFAANYSLVDRFPFAGDTYYVFVRNAYPHAAELTAICGDADR